MYRKQADGLGVWGITRSRRVRRAEGGNKGGQRLEKGQDGGGWKYGELRKGGKNKLRRK